MPRATYLARLEAADIDYPAAARLIWTQSARSSHGAIQDHNDGLAVWSFTAWPQASAGLLALGCHRLGQVIHTPSNAVWIAAPMLDFLEHGALLRIVIWPLVPTSNKVCRSFSAFGLEYSSVPRSF